jgi:hypothetical protein
MADELNGAAGTARARRPVGGYVAETAVAALTAVATISEGPNPAGTTSAAGPGETYRSDVSALPALPASPTVAEQSGRPARSTVTACASG